MLGELSITELTEVIAVIFTFVVVIINFRTLGEMKAGREIERSAQLILTPKTSNISVSLVVNEAAKLDVSADYKGAVIQLVNVGSGPATDIKIEWELVHHGLDQTVASKKHQNLELRIDRRIGVIGYGGIEHIGTIEKHSKAAFVGLKGGNLHAFDIHLPVSLPFHLLVDLCNEEDTNTIDSFAKFHSIIKISYLDYLNRQNTIKNCLTGEFISRSLDANGAEYIFALQLTDAEV